MTESMAQRTIDGEILPSIHDSSAGCFVGIQFPTGYVGAVNEVSFFLDEFNRETIVDHLFIEASTDNFVSSVVGLDAVSEEAHEGWNYYDLTVNGQPAKYQYYRIRSDASDKGCNDIGEINFFGFEVIEDQNDNYSCNIELV